VSGSTRPPAPGLDPVEVAAGTLACLPDMTPARLRALWARGGGPVGALAAVRRGAVTDLLATHAPPERLPARLELAARWRAAVQDDDAILATLARRGTHVMVDGRPGYPIADDVPQRPLVLLGEGDPGVLDRPRVAVVGTRAATPHGLADAHEIGAVLGAAGVTVVSGLAIGIDAAAHEGALAAGGAAVGVLGTGLDIIYPRRHRILFERVRHTGMLVTELGYGVAPRAEQFPVRNRIIAALADIVVVVEATARGGARITAERAVEYGRDVMAMPGSRRNPAAAGTNALIADGALALLEPSDVLLALGMHAGAQRARRVPPSTGDAGLVFGACGGDGATLDQLASRTGLRPAAVAVAARELERGGWLERAQGMWWPKE
jgi:DNA processing protein